MLLPCTLLLAGLAASAVATVLPNFEDIEDVAEDVALYASSAETPYEFFDKRAGEAEHLETRAVKLAIPTDDGRAATNDDLFAEAVSYSLAGTASQRSDIRTYSSNPAHLGDNENCTPYEYVHVLGGDGSPRLGRLRAPDAIELSNYYVKQTAYGDCAFGASMLALIYSGRSELIINSLRRNTEDTRNNRWTMTVQRNKRTSVRVRIDDRLAYSDSEKCNNFNSFWPCNPNVGAKCAVTAQYFQIPLMEKAFAKYMDAYPSLRSQKARDGNAVGYKAMQGIRAAIVLEGMTGFPSYSLTLADAKVAAFKSRLQAIVSYNMAGVVGTPNATNLDGIFGTESIDASGRNTLTTTATLSGERTTVTVRTTANKRGFTVSYGDNRSFTLVGGHAYGISVRDSSSSTLAVRNPHGADTSAAGSSISGSDGLIRIPMDIACRVFRITSWVQEE